MMENNIKIRPFTGLWQDILSTYRFWGFFLFAFFIGLAESPSLDVIYILAPWDVDFGTVKHFTNLGIFTAGLLSLYFMRVRLKAALVFFSLLYLFSAILSRFPPSTHVAPYLAAIFIKNIGYYGILLTLLASLLTTKLPIRLFLVGYLIIWFWMFLGNELGTLFMIVDVERFDSYYDGIDGIIKPLSVSEFLHHLLCLTPAILAVLTASFLKVKMFTATSVISETLSSPLTQSKPSEQWLWQDIVSTYKFWGLVLISFFVGFTYNENHFFDLEIANSLSEKFGLATYRFMFFIGPLIAGLLTLYLIRKPIKVTLITFCSIYLISALLMIFMSLGYIKNSAVYIVSNNLQDIGYYGVILTVLSALIAARLPLKSVLIAIFIVWFWSYVGRGLGYAYDNIQFSYQPIDDGVTPPFSFIFFQFIIPIIPVALAALAACLLKSKMFSEPPTITVEAKPASARTPFVVFIAALVVPFYFLYWLFKRPGELKTLAPNMHQPSPIGALCLGLFAPMVLPIWFHDVRKGLGAKLKDRSARRIGVAALFIPAIAAGMAQSDYDQIKEDDNSV